MAHKRTHRLYVLWLDNDGVKRWYRVEPADEVNLGSLNKPNKRIVGFRFEAIEDIKNKKDEGELFS